MRGVVLFLSIFFMQFAHAELLLPQEAFKFSAKKVNNGINIQFKIAKNHLLYKEKFEFFIDNPNVRAGIPLMPSAKSKFDANFNKEIEYYKQQVDIFLPIVETKDAFNLKVVAQGCAENGICYPPTPYYYHVNLNTNSMSKANIENFLQKQPNIIAKNTFSFLRHPKSAGLETIPPQNQVNTTTTNKNSEPEIKKSEVTKVPNKIEKIEIRQDQSKFYWLFIFMCIICTAIISHPAFNQEGD
jgi:thiol:disulfide interchange protein